MIKDFVTVAFAPVSDMLKSIVIADPHVKFAQ